MAIKVYTTPSCGYCSVVKSFLREKGVSFSEYNVASDRARAEEMIRKSGQMGVPVIDVNGRIIVGFNREKLERTLNN